MQRIVPELDGVRALAILAVIAFHTASADSAPQAPLVVAAASIGWCGVDLFFVLSGFLITGILLDSRGAPHAWRNFYARRILRIFPLFYLALAFHFHLLPGVAHLFSKLQHFRPVEETWYWLYASNWSPSLGTAQPRLTHLWSLAIEEQFYIAWPLLIFVIPARYTRLLCGFLIALAVAARIYFYIALADSAEIILRNTLCRLDSLAVGALWATFVRDPERLRVTLELRRPLLVISALTLVLGFALRHGPSPRPAVMFVVGYTAIAVLCGYFIAWAREGGLGLQRRLRTGWLSSIGRYSYAMYIVHLAICAWVHARFAPVIHAQTNTWLASAIVTLEVAVTSALSYAAGFVSWHVFERHFLRLKERFSTPTTVARQQNAV